MRPSIRMTDCSASGIAQRFSSRSRSRLPLLLAGPLGHPAVGVGAVAKAGYPGRVPVAVLGQHFLGAPAAPAVAPAAAAQGRVRQVAVAALHLPALPHAASGRRAGEPRSHPECRKADARSGPRKPAQHKRASAGRLCESVSRALEQCWLASVGRGFLSIGLRDLVAHRAPTGRRFPWLAPSSASGNRCLPFATGADAGCTHRVGWGGRDC